MVSWSGPPIPVLWGLGGGVGAVCPSAFVWLRLLCSWHLSPSALPMDPAPTPHLPSPQPSPCSPWKSHGPLCACACVRVEIHVGERYMGAGGGEGCSEFRAWDQGAVPPRLVGYRKQVEEGLRSPSAGGSPWMPPPSPSYPVLCPASGSGWHLSLMTVSKEMPFCPAFAGWKEQGTHSLVPPRVLGGSSPTPSDLFLRGLKGRRKERETMTSVEPKCWAGGGRGLLRRSAVLFGC